MNTNNEDFDDMYSMKRFRLNSEIESPFEQSYEQFSAQNEKNPETKKGSEQKKPKQIRVLLINTQRIEQFGKSQRNTKIQTAVKRKSENRKSDGAETRVFTYSVGNLLGKRNFDKI